MQGALSMQCIASGLVSNIIAIRNCESKVCLIISCVQAGAGQLLAKSQIRMPKQTCNARYTVKLCTYHTERVCLTGMAQCSRLAQTAYPESENTHHHQ